MPREQSSRETFGRWQVIVVLVLLLAAGLRFYGLHDKSLWFDEIFQVSMAQTKSAAQIISAHLHDPAAPLDPLITHVMLLLGNQEYWLRFPAACFSILTTAICFALGRAMFGRTEGTLAAFLVAISAFHIRFAQTVRTYALFAFLSALSMLFLWHALCGDRRRHWAAWIVTGWLSLTAHAFAAYLAIAQLGYGVLTLAVRSRGWLDAPPRKSRLRKLLLGSLLILLGAAVQFGLAASRFAFRAAGGTTARSLSWSYVASNWIVPARRLFAQLGNGRVAGLVLVAVLASVCLHRRARRHPAVWLLVSCCIVPATLAIASSRSEFSAKYAFPVLPAIMVLAALGAATLADGAERYVRSRGLEGPMVWRGLLALFVLSFTVASLPTLRGHWSPSPTDRSYHGDWRSTASFLAQHVSPGDVILVDALSPTDRVNEDWIERCLFYYLPNEQLRAMLVPVSKTAWPAYASIQNQVWGVVFHPDRRVSLENVLSETSSFRMITVFLPARGLGGAEQRLALLQDLTLLQQSPWGLLDVLLATARSHVTTGRLDLAYQELDAVRAMHLQSVAADLQLAMTEQYVKLIEQAVRSQ